MKRSKTLILEKSRNLKKVNSFRENQFDPNENEMMIKNKRILLVDDEPYNLLGLQIIVQ